MKVEETDVGTVVSTKGKGNIKRVIAVLPEIASTFAAFITQHKKIGNHDENELQEEEEEADVGDSNGNEEEEDEEEEANVGDNNEEEEEDGDNEDDLVSDEDYEDLDEIYDMVGGGWRYHDEVPFEPLKRFIKNNPDLDINEFSENLTFGILQVTIYNGNDADIMDFLHCLIKERKADVNFQDYNGNTACEIASGFGYANICKLLHLHGAVDCDDIDDLVANAVGSFVTYNNEVGWEEVRNYHSKEPTRQIMLAMLSALDIGRLGRSSPLKLIRDRDLFSSIYSMLETTPEFFFNI
jgi:hypothetical protein